jgi:hypothetical protein
MNPRLSILIPSIPSRFEKSFNLYNKLIEETENMDIEILMLTDNKKRSIGLKREALKNISKGKYFMFVDDDDDIKNIPLLYEATENDVDVITFKQKSRNTDGSHFIVTFGLGNEVEHKQNKQGQYVDLKRPPFQVCAWNQKFKDFAYPDINYAEDWGWIKQVLPLAKSEYFIDEVIHLYNFDMNVTEADTSSNELWENPNISQEKK